MECVFTEQNLVTTDTKSGTHGGFSQPVVVSKIEPEYSDEARKAKLEGTVRLYLEIDEQGHTRNVRVAHSLGLGLDEKAVGAVLKWRFRPALKNGQPIATSVNVDITFQLTKENPSLECFKYWPARKCWMLEARPSERLEV
jgi:TonB family protein